MTPARRRGAGGAWTWAAPRSTWRPPRRGCRVGSMRWWSPRCPGRGPGARFTTAFEDTAAWLVCHATLAVVAMLLRVAWRSVADIITRVVAERAGKIDRLAGLRRIGIDEISYRYAGDLVKGFSRISLDRSREGSWGVSSGRQDASLSSRSRIPSKIF